MDMHFTLGDLLKRSCKHQIIALSSVEWKFRNPCPVLSLCIGTRKSSDIHLLAFFSWHIPVELIPDFWIVRTIGEAFTVVGIWTIWVLGRLFRLSIFEPVWAVFLSPYIKVPCHFFRILFPSLRECEVSIICSCHSNPDELCVCYFWSSAIWPVEVVRVNWTRLSLPLKHLSLLARWPLEWDRIVFTTSCVNFSRFPAVSKPI